MKPPVFEYHRPATIREALALLERLGDEAKVLAGGQSLVPMMNFRIAAPAHLVDLNRIAELASIRVDADGSLSIGAMTRQRAVERAADVARGWPLIAEALPHIGHAQIRNRGTVGGSLVHNDPSAELPAVMVALDGLLTIRSGSDTRTVPADGFFIDYMTTALDDAELLTEVRVPDLPPRTGCAFEEISRRHGDFALVAAAAVLAVDETGGIQRARLVLTGVGSGPVRAQDAESVLVGSKTGSDVFGEAARRAVRGLRPPSDLHADSEYRREVGAVLARRVLARAAERAGAPRATAEEESSG